jgi:hypothetical protein
MVNKGEAYWCGCEKLKENDGWKNHRGGFMKAGVEDESAP